MGGLLERPVRLPALGEEIKRGLIAGIKALVDELDELEPEFTAYDRLRFDGPVSRDTYINSFRAATSEAAPIPSS